MSRSRILKSLKVSKADRNGAAISVAVGVLLAVLPHLIRWWLRGHYAYFADNDDLLYIEVASRSYHGELFHLSDPVFARDRPVMYPAFLFVPGIVLAKLLFLGPEGIGLIWRIWAGVSIGLAWYFLWRQFFKKELHAVLLTVFMLSDPSVMYGKPLYLLVMNTLTTAFPNSLRFLPHGFNLSLTPQWRIITPGLSMAFLLLDLGLLARAVQKPTRSRALIAGLGYGILYYVYFYYWTAVSLGLFIVFCLDRARRKLYVQTALFGIIIGLPALLFSFLIKKGINPDALPRNDDFLAIGHFTELMIPKWPLLVLALFFIFIAKKRQDLLFAASLVVASFFLLNQQLITGLQISNFHWNYSLSPPLTLLVVLMAVESFRKNRRKLHPAVAIAFVTLVFSAGTYLRVNESIRPGEGTTYSDAYLGYQSQRALRPALAENSVVTGDYVFGDMASIFEKQQQLYSYSTRISLSISDEDLDWRAALAAYVKGVTSEHYSTYARRELVDVATGAWMRDPALFTERLGSRTRKFEAISQDPRAALDRYHVRYAGLDARTEPPALFNRGWHKLQSGPYWQIWERETSIFPR